MSKPAAQTQPESRDESELAVSPGLYWTIKRSFVDYVASTAGGTFSMSAEVTVDDTGTFHFPLSDARHEAGAWTLAFSGDVRFSGHFGMLFVGIADPVVTMPAAAPGSLTIADVAAPVAGRNLTIASIEPARPLPFGEYLVWPPLIPSLTLDGVGLFGDTYPEGLTLDPVKIAIPRTNIRI